MITVGTLVESLFATEEVFTRGINRIDGIVGIVQPFFHIRPCRKFSFAFDVSIVIGFRWINQVTTRREDSSAWCTVLTRVQLEIIVDGLNPRLDRTTFARAIERIGFASEFACIHRVRNWLRRLRRGLGCSSVLYLLLEGKDKLPKGFNVRRRGSSRFRSHFV